MVCKRMHRPTNLKNVPITLLLMDLQDLLLANLNIINPPVLLGLELNMVVNKIMNDEAPK